MKKKLPGCPYWKVSVVLFTAIEEHMRKLFGSTTLLCIHIYCWPSHSGGLYKNRASKWGDCKNELIFLFLYIPLSSNIPQWPGWQVHPWKNNIPILYPDPGREEHRKDATSGSQETGNKGACGKPTGLPAGWPTCWSTISWKRRTTFLRIRSPLYFGGLSCIQMCLKRHGAKRVVVHLGAYGANTLKPAFCLLIDRSFEFWCLSDLCGIVVEVAICWIYSRSYNISIFGSGDSVISNKILCL